MRSYARRVYGRAIAAGYSPARLAALKYRSLYYLSYFVSLLPIPLRFILLLSLSNKEGAGEHHYGRVYGKILFRFKYRPMKLLEIGVGGYAGHTGGASLNAWQLYFPFARIIGVDIEDRSVLANLRTRIYRLDQGDAAALRDLAQRERAFDVVIDDGSHQSRHVVQTFNALFPCIREGGVYIVEDVQTSYWDFDGWGGRPLTSPQFDETAMGYFTRLSRYLNYMEIPASERRKIEGVEESRLMLELAQSIGSIRFLHNLVVIEKHRNNETSTIDEQLQAK